LAFAGLKATRIHQILGGVYVFLGDFIRKSMKNFALADATFPAQ
jgi:hypothetical protein